MTENQLNKLKARLMNIQTQLVGAGVDIDELSTILRSNTSFIYQKAFEKLLKEQTNDKN